MSRSSARRPADSSGRQYHLGVAPGEVGSPVVLVGDPARADRVAAHFDHVRLTRRHREFVTHTGSRGGVEMSVTATGIGCDNMEIVVAELLACVPKPVLLRIGSCGGLQPQVGVGDVVISTGAVRLESTSLAFVEEGFPAMAHHELVLALQTAALQSGTRFHVGLTAAAAGFYGWQGRPIGGIQPRFPDIPERLARQGVLNLEMETSTLFTLGTLAGLRTGAVCAVFANRPNDEFIGALEKGPAEDRAIEVGLRALDVLAAMDRHGTPFSLTGLL